MPDAANPILLYHPDAYQVARPDLKGRHSAGESFITAFLAQCPGPDVFALCGTAEHFADFSRAVDGAGRNLVPRRVVRTDLAALRDQGLVHLPHPEVTREAQLRSFAGHTTYAISGVTHTIASERMIAEFAALVSAPVMPWDAIVCTSRAVLAAVQCVIERSEENLRARLGATRFARPLLPVIPLGVHAARFAPKEGDRARWRQKLGIGDDVTAVLFFGRLSVHGKASPFQLAQAAERAAQQSGRGFAVIWAGWFNNDFQREAFMTTAKAMAPSVPFYEVDGRAADARFSIWSAADVFCSMSDNIQETFGLTVIEAMAAGLPVLASNWDGYRDTVEHGVSGFLVDTLMPTAPLADAAYRYLAGVDTYDRFIGGISQFCAVNAAQLARDLALLAADPELRRRMGEAGRRAVETKFEWSVVVQSYRELWREQRDRLVRARAEEIDKSAAWKVYDPAVVFAGYPSHRLSETSALERGPHYDELAALIAKPGVVTNAAVLMREEQVRQLHAAFGSGRPQTVKTLLEPFPSHLRRPALRTLHWMIKIGVLGLHAADA